MSSVAFFVKKGVVVRKSTTDFTPKEGEKLVVLDEETAKGMTVTPWIPGSSLYDKPEDFPFCKISADDIQTEYTPPTVDRQAKKVEALLSSILVVLGKSLPTELQESLSLLQSQLAVHAEMEEYWGRVVYTEGAATLTDGDGITVEVVQDGELKVTFESAFAETASFGVWVTFETDGVRYVTSHSVGGTDCTISLKAISDGAAVTEATFSVLAKGRLGSAE